MHTFTKATEADIPRIQALAEVAFRHTYLEILTPEQMEYMMQWMYSTESLQTQLALGHEFHILSVEGQDVGYVSFNRETTDEEGVLFHLQKIYLLPQMQGRGLGVLLLQRAESCMMSLSEGKSVRYELNVNRNNRAVLFYEHMGLQKLREGDFPIGNGFYMNDFIMGKRLR